MILEKIQEQIKDAMRARDEIRLSTLRLLLSALKYEQVAKMRTLTAEEELAVVSKQVKQRKESIESYEKGGRHEAATKEKTELEILMEYLPEQLSEEKLELIIQTTLLELGVTNISEMGKVIGAVNAKVKGQAEGAVIAKLVKEKLS